MTEETAKSKLYREILKKYWGYDDFRGIQQLIVESIGKGKDTLGLMPTGGGKSITFQVPALAMEGVCLVITPLIALMKDQVANLKKKGIKAAAIYTGLTHNEVITTLENAVFGGVKLLYVSPERLTSEIFLNKLRHINISFITIDEAHCISQWGYDFRPAYLKIAKIRQQLPGKAVLALTATATPRVVEDIQQQLAFVDGNVFKMSFERKNLAYVVRYCENKTEEMVHILKCTKGCAIVYVRNRKHTAEIAKMLNEEGISATFYHAGLENSTKDERQDNWQKDKVRVMVATNAFGMGIDKPDVRVVIHIDCPDCIEAYFQEAGRAGRDGKRAYAVLISSKTDGAALKAHVRNSFPEKDYIRKVYDALAYYYQIAVGSGYMKGFEFHMERFCRTYHFYPTQVNAALNLLTKAGYIEYREEEEHIDRLRFTLERHELYLIERGTPNEEKVMVQLLRLYGGLFIDYEIISPSLLAERTGMSIEDIYNTLKKLTERKVLHFIPGRSVPHLRYTQRREESRFLVFPPSIYEERKKEAMERAEAMINYFNNKEKCRSQLLLSYFGETDAKNCGCCDTCCQRRKEELQRVCSEIIAMLDDGRAHDIDELLDIQASQEEIKEAVRMLTASEKIYCHEGKVMSARR